MYSPAKLIVKNIGPIKNIEYDFDDKVVLLTGENLTDEGQDSNGSGKSFILESISYATTGTSFRKVSDAELVREGEAEAYIAFDLYNAPLDRVLSIERYIYSGNKSGRLKIAINGEEQKQITSVNEGNKFILSELGLSREDVLNYFMISKEKYTSFFSSSDAAKKELISRFSKANLIDELFPKIEKEKAETQLKLSTLDRDLAGIEARIQTMKEDSDTEKLKEEKELNEEKIKSIEQEISNLLEENSKLEDTNLEINSRVQKLTDQISKCKADESITEKVKGFQFKIENINSEINKIRKETKESETLLSKIEMSLHGVAECPKCEHRFNVSDPNFDVEEGEELKVELEEIIKEFKKDITLKQVEIPELERSIRELNDEMNKQKRIKNDLELEKSRIESTSRNNTKTFESNSKLIYQKESMIEKLKDIDFSIDPKNSQKIKEAEKEFKSKEKEISSLKLGLSFYDEWVLNFKSFKTYLANKSLHNITNQTNLYLEKLGSSIRVKFEGYKELKSGKTKEEISIRIFKFGEDRGNFGKLSGGEKARVEVATIFALSSLINLSSESGGLNFVIIDEILESLDSTGLRSMIKAIAKIDQGVMLVTHGKVDSSEGFNEVRIIKDRGVSSLKKY